MFVLSWFSLVNTEEREIWQVGCSSPPRLSRCAWTLPSVKRKGTYSIQGFGAVWSCQEGSWSSRWTTVWNIFFCQIVRNSRCCSPRSPTTQNHGPSMGSANAQAKGGQTGDRWDSADGYRPAIAVLFLRFAYGGAITMERPKGPVGQDKKWGIWLAGFFRRLCLGGAIRLMTFLQQAPLRAAYHKPTTMMAGRLPGFAEAIFKGYGPHWRCSEDLQSRQWRTMKAKACPVRMCRNLTEQFVKFAENVRREGPFADIPGLHEMLQELAAPSDPYMVGGGSVMKQDYQGGHANLFVRGPSKSLLKDRPWPNWFFSTLGFYCQCVFWR